MSDKIKNHVNYYCKITSRVFATYEEALEDAKFYILLKRLKKLPYEYVEICFIHTLND